MKTYDSMVDYEELHVLINLVPDEKMQVKYPLDDFPLFKVQPGEGGYRLTMQYADGFHGRTPMLPRYEKERPSYDDLRSCMISSGVLDFANIDEVKRKIGRYMKLQRGVRFALDTNMLYFNFVRNHDFLDPREILLVDTVKEEIKKMMNRKYSQEDVTVIKNSSPRGKELLDELRNGRVKRSRKAGLAYREWEYLHDRDAMVIDGIRESSPQEGVCDRIIVETLRGHRDKIKQDIVLLTSDDAMIDLCKIEEIEYIKCDIEHRVDSVDCTYRNLANLLYDLSKVFGFIKFGPSIIYGAYRGYTSNRPDVLKVVTENRELHKELEKELETCRKLKEIGIVK